MKKFILALALIASPALAEPAWINDPVDLTGMNQVQKELVGLGFMRGYCGVYRTSDAFLAVPSELAPTFYKEWFKILALGAAKGAASKPSFQVCLKLLDNHTNLVNASR